MRFQRLALAVSTALAVTSPTLAQQHQHPPGQAKRADMAMHCGAGMAMMHGMAGAQHDMRGARADSMRHEMMDMMGPPTPAMILSHKAQLGLSADQVSRLEALQKEAEPACTEHMRLGMTTLQAANQLLEAATPDYTAYSAKLKEASAHMVEAHVEMAKAAVGARNVLTTAQRQTLKDRMAQMHKGL